MLWSVLKI